MGNSRKLELHIGSNGEEQRGGCASRCRADFENTSSALILTLYTSKESSEILGRALVGDPNSK